MLVEPAIQVNFVVHAPAPELHARHLETGEEVWLRDGKLFDTIRASIATPLVFTPFDYGGRKLLDGTLVSSLPIAPTLNDTTELTVALIALGSARTAQSFAATRH